MAFIYVTEQGALIKKTGPHLQVLKDGEVLADKTLSEVDALICFGGVHPTTDAMLALLDKGADIAFLTLNGHFKGRMVSAAGKNSVLREKQFERMRHPEKRLEMARSYVAAKIGNGMDVLYDYHRSAKNPFEFEEKTRLEEFRKKSLTASSAESLRGFEGGAAKLYFQGFSRCLMHDRIFPGRVFRPSTDPVNALLSFGYSFIARELQSMLDSAGLDPFIGFYHEITYGRASLSLDLMEEFRHPLVDRLVLKIFNRKLLDDKDFEKEESGQVYLKKESLKIFVRHYEEWANELNRTWENDREMSWRQAMWKQVENLRSAIEHGADYHPFSWKGREA